MNNNLIVFFNDWGLCKNHIATIKNNSYNLEYFDEIQNFDRTKIANIDFEKYNKKILIACSLGVYFASLLPESIFQKFDQTIAINGTEKPYNNTYGINTQIFKATLENLNTKNMDKFNFRMCNGKDIYEKFISINNTRSLTSIKDELQFYYDLFIRDKVDRHKPWTKAIISLNDLIFTPQNQKNYWQSQKIKTIEIDAPHYIFNNINSWDEIINL